MTENQPRKSPDLTLDDLLRLKRAESPSPEFWSEFSESFKRRSLRQFVQCSRQQRKSLWHGWGLGTSLATLLALAIPFGLLFLDRQSTPGTVAKEVKEIDSILLAAYVSPVLSVAEAAFPEKDWGMDQFTVVDSNFIIETLQAEPKRALQSAAGSNLVIQSDSRGQYVSDALTVSETMTASRRSATFF